MDQSQIPEPTELIYMPSPSWAPALTAVGLAVLAIGAFAGWVIALAGGILLARAGLYWYRDYVEQAERLPRRQRLTSAVIPPATIAEQRRPR
jgi:hypothetical protein